MSKKLEQFKYDGLNFYSLSVPDSYVSYTYNKNMTVLENIYALWNEIQKIDGLFWNIKELLNAMVEFLNGEGLEMHITAKLEEWLEDGTLEELINDTLFNMKLDKSEFEEYKTQNEKEMQQLLKDVDMLLKEVDNKTTPYYFNFISLFNNIWDRKSSNDNFNVQGYTTDGINHYMAFIPLYSPERDGVLRKYDRNGVLLLERNVSDIYHANSMDIHNNELYLSVMREKEIRVYDLNFNLKRVIIAENYVSSLSIYKNEIWTIGDTKNTINILDLNGVFKRSVNLSGGDLETSKTNQSFTVSNEKIYMIKSDPDALFIFDKDGYLIRKSEMNYRFGLKEFEDVKIVNDRIFISYQGGMNSFQWNTGVAVANFKNEIVNPNHFNETDETIRVYVNNSYSLNNGDGTNEKPFKSIQQALDYVQFISNRQKVIEVIESPKKYEYFRVNGHNNLTVELKGNSVNGIDFYNSTNIIIRDAVVDYNGTGNYLTEVNNSNVTFRDCTYNHGSKKAINCIYQSNVIWLGTNVSLGESSVVVQSGGYFFNNTRGDHRMILPYGTIWRVNQPFRIWNGSENSGTHSFRPEIDVSNMNEIIFIISNGERIHVRGGTGRVDLRMFNMDNQTEWMIAGEFVVMLNNNSFTIESLLGLSIRPTGVTATTPNFKIVEVLAW